MIVSHFAVKHGDKVQSQFYWLLTNLEDKPYSFRLTLHAPWTGLEQRMAVSVQHASETTVLPLEPAGTDKYRPTKLIKVAPRVTARIKLMPFDLASWGTPTQPMGAWGHAELSIPLKYDWQGNPSSQGSKPVKVLLHAYELDYVLADGGGPRDPRPVTLSTGRAENEIVPQPLVTLTADSQAVEDVIQALKGAWGKDALDGADEMDVDGFLERPQSITPLLTLLGRVGRHPDAVSALNGLLEDGGQGVQVTAKPPVVQARSKRA